MKETEEKNKRGANVEENRRQKSEEKQVRENEDRFRVLESCEALVHSVLTIDMDHINKLKTRSFGCFFAITLVWKG